MYFNTPMQLFSHLNYAQVMHGLGMFNNSAIDEKYKKHMDMFTIISNASITEGNMIAANEPVFTHRQAINILKERYEEIKYKF